jgi:hypothetical protein
VLGPEAAKFLESLIPAGTTVTRFDWKLQDPNNVIANPTIAMVDGTLSAGELAPGGKVAGKVCFTDPKLTGEYAILNEELVSLSSTPVRWKTAL